MLFMLNEGMSLGAQSQSQRAARFTGADTHVDGGFGDDDLKFGKKLSLL